MVLDFPRVFRAFIRLLFHFDPSFQTENFGILDRSSFCKVLSKKNDQPRAIIWLFVPMRSHPTAECTYSAVAETCSPHGVDRPEPSDRASIRSKTREEDDVPQWWIELSGEQRTDKTRVLTDLCGRRLHSTKKQIRNKNSSRRHPETIFRSLIGSFRCICYMMGQKCLFDICNHHQTVLSVSPASSLRFLTRLRRRTFI